MEEAADDRERNVRRKEMNGEERRGEKPIEKEVIDGKEYGRKKHGIRQEESIGVTLRGYRRAGEEHR